MIERKDGGREGRKRKKMCISFSMSHFMYHQNTNSLAKKSGSSPQETLTSVYPLQILVCIHNCSEMHPGFNSILWALWNFSHFFASSAMHTEMIFLLSYRRLLVDF
jgi:hypothetical protein